MLSILPHEIENYIYEFYNPYKKNYKICISDMMNFNDMKSRYQALTDSLTAELQYISDNELRFNGKGILQNIKLYYQFLDEEFSTDD